jgi:hypothetical protein
MLGGAPETLHSVGSLVKPQRQFGMEMQQRDAVEDADVLRLLNGRLGAPLLDARAPHVVTKMVYILVATELA